MKHFIYTRTEKANRQGHTVYTIKLHQIVRGSPVLVGQASESFCSDWQQCRDLLKALKLWPKKADAVDANGNKLYYYPTQLREAGIINVNQIAC